MDMYEQNNAFPQDSDNEPAAVTPGQTNQKRAVGAAAAGTVALGAAAYALSRLDDADSSTGEGSGLTDGSGDNNADGNGNGSGAAAPLVTPVALSATGDGPNGTGSGPGDGADHRSLDDLTFEEAFAAARHAQGPGHLFTWHGGLYNTFYQEELDRMSMADRLAFVESMGLNADHNGGPTHTDRPVMAHHRQPSAGHHHDAPAMAEVQPNPATEPMMVVPIAATATHPEVVPVPDGQHDAHNVDMLTASHLGEEHHSDGLGSIDSMDHHDDTHHGDADHDGSDDDQQVHFTY